MPPSKDNRVPLAGSERHHHPSARRRGAARQDQILDIVVLLRPHRDAHKPHDMEEWARIPDRHQRARRGTAQAATLGATQEDADKVAAYATDHGLKVVDINLPRRIVQLSGTVAEADRAFGVTLGLYETPEETYHSHDGPIH